MTSLISENYRALNSELHRTNNAYGISSSKWAATVRALAKSIKAETVLDYGAGKCRLREGLEEFGNIPFALFEYDPAIEALQGGKHPADLVVCTDVLEHIEPDCLDAVLDDLRALTLKATFLTIATCAAKKILADGRNAHLIQENPRWWLPKLMNRWELRSFGAQPGQFITVLAV